MYGKTWEEVHRKWTKLQEKARQGPVASTVPTVPTVQAYLSYWLDNVVRPNLAPLTWATCETLIRLYIIPGIGTKRLDRLQVRDVQTWLNRVRVTCQCCEQGKEARRGEGKRRCCAVGRCCQTVPSARTVKDLRTVLRSALSNAVTEELVGRNVARLVKLPTGRAHKSKAWSSEGARAFLDTARSRQYALYPAYVLILVMGLRKGEVLGLQWSNVDMDEGELTISHQLQRVRRQLLHRETKTEASDATLPMPEIGVNALRQRKFDQKKARLAAGELWQPSDLVFATPGGPARPCWWILTYTRALSCRSSGHAQFAVTMEIYTKVSSKQTRDALKRLGTAWEKAWPGECCCTLLLYERSEALPE